MPTRTLTETRREGAVYATNTVAIAASDDTTLNIRGLHKLRATATVTSFGAGTITITVAGSLDGTSFTTITTQSITAAGSYELIGSGTAVSGLSVATPSPSLVDVTGYNFIRFTRGADSNTGTVVEVIEARR